MELDKDFWNNRYVNQQMGWDIGYPSTPLKEFVYTLEDKRISLTIDGPSLRTKSHCKEPRQCLVCTQ